jgi:hypothetical protein
MREGYLSFLKWLLPLNLSKVRLFKGSDDYNLPTQHLHQGVPPKLRFSDSYTRGPDIVLSDYSMHGQHLHQGVPPGLRLSDSYTRGCHHYSHPLKLSLSSDTK